MIAVHIADGDKFDSASLERGPGIEHPHQPQPMRPSLILASESAAGSAPGIWLRTTAPAVVLRKK